MKMFLSLTTDIVSKINYILILNFLYARSGQVGNRIFHVNEQLFLKKFVNVITK